MDKSKKHTCLDCEGFAWWDGDYCCTLHMTILSHTEDDSYKALNPEFIEENECPDFKRTWSKKHREIEHQAWELNNKKPLESK